jgi:2-C-methyl-D-erythritol 2,4-cyclodiphosphate synthase
VSTGVPALRVGHGVDVHRFSADGDGSLILGGVVVTGEGARPLEGHSDADALAHAVADAVLGAAGLGDLGGHAPDTDPRWRGADSMVILAGVVDRAREAGWVVVNADCTITAERPRLAPFVAAMSRRLSDVAGGPVNVKATTAEGLGSLGRGEGIACDAVVLMGAAAPGAGAPSEER